MQILIAFFKLPFLSQLTTAIHLFLCLSIATIINCTHYQSAFKQDLFTYFEHVLSIIRII
jgi:hypothetical protein